MKRLKQVKDDPLVSDGFFSFEDRCFLAAFFIVMRYSKQIYTETRLQSFQNEIPDEYYIVDYEVLYRLMGGGSGINPGVLVHRGLRLMLHFIPKVSCYAIIKYL